MTKNTQLTRRIFFLMLSACNAPSDNVVKEHQQAAIKNRGKKLHFPQRYKC